ncbi:hypothetical protein CLV36_1314 [Laceyella sediminis]|uniref:Uncharacterized protein n=1 Tax=Laceyella sediminis TaxID=573074 RepID=A0ABX5EJA7_9BACL|nr:hypothetical protein CLV36_1314 [Laceyella sediminis]
MTLIMNRRYRSFSQTVLCLREVMHEIKLDKSDVGMG